MSNLLPAYSKDSAVWELVSRWPPTPACSDGIVPPAYMTSPSSAAHAGSTATSNKQNATIFFISHSSNFTARVYEDYAGLEGTRGHFRKCPTRGTSGEARG